MVTICVEENATEKQEYGTEKLFDNCEKKRLRLSATIEEQHKHE